MSTTQTPSFACSSLRFVESAGSRAVGNLAALWGADPSLAARVEQASLDDLRIEPAKNGQASLTALLPHGRSLQLHSKYDPRAEAAKLVERVGGFDTLAWFVLGFGLGYHVEDLLRRLPTTARVWVIEPDAAVLRAAVESRDVEAMISDARLRFIHEIDRPRLLNEFQSSAALVHAGVRVLEHPSSVQRQSAVYAEARGWIEELQSFARTAINTLVLNAARTLGNIARNIPWYAAAPGPQRLAGAYRGEPAIVVSAGPSLRRNRHLLREAKGKAVIIAVQTTLKPLLEIGVEPDFVTSLDYSDISARFYHDLPRGLRTELVAEAKATDVLFSLYPGPVTLLGSEFADDMLRGAGVAPKTRLRSGATVAHLAFYLAEYLGCDPIIFVGQDLGFSDGLCYTPGTSYDDVWRPELGRFCTMEMKQWEQIARERPILRRVPDHLGRPMYTEQRLFTYLQQFERDFAASRSRIIDASEGGAMKRGATAMSLREAMDAFCGRALRGGPSPHEGVAGASMDAARAAVERRIGEAERVAGIARATLPLLEEICDHVETDQSRVNRAIAKIDPLREQMNTFGRTYDLIMYLAQRNEYARYKADLQITGRERTPAELQRRQTERDIDNVRSVIEACATFMDQMRESLERIDEWAFNHAEAA